jgi:hypothetical protein
LVPGSVVVVAPGVVVVVVPGASPPPSPSLPAQEIRLMKINATIGNHGDADLLIFNLRWNKLHNANLETVFFTY